MQQHDENQIKLRKGFIGERIDSNLHYCITFTLVVIVKKSNFQNPNCTKYCIKHVFKTFITKSKDIIFSFGPLANSLTNFRH